jgi:SpoVK/Ycf46/Vps4 family AAA+-type ATPase
MARSDLLLSLVRAATAGDKETLRSTTEAIAAEERAKNHHVLADRLQRALAAVPVSQTAFVAAPTMQRATGKDLILEVEPRRRLEDLILPLPVAESARQLIAEQARAEVLRANGYEPRHRVLLSGPPGNGKTSFAEAIAEALSLPLLVVRYDTLVGSYLGETNARLRGLFDYVRTRPCVLFFDEFDAVGKERGDTHETGEIKRVVSFLLTQLDHMPSYNIVVAATNHAELLDRAVWRRFQMRLEFPAPDSQQVSVFIDRIFSTWPNSPKVTSEIVASRLGVASYAEALDFCQNARRRQILGLGGVDIDRAIDDELRLWDARVRPEQLNGVRSQHAAAPPRSKGGRAASNRQSRFLPRP